MMKRVVAMTLAFAMVAGTLGGCGNSTDDKSNDASKETADEGNDAEEEKDAEKEAVVQTGVAAGPQDFDFSGVELTIWMPLMFNSQYNEDYGELEIWQEVEKRLGVELTFIHPTKGSEVEEFNLLIAGGDLPDIIYTGWAESKKLFAEGGDTYIDNGVVLDLTSLVDEYMPNYKWALENVVVDGTERKNFYTDSGRIYEILAISPYEEYAYQGIAVRYDLLASVGYEKYDTLPQTIDEYEDAMVALKEAGVEYPLYLPKDGVDGGNKSSGFVAAYGIAADFYQVDNEVRYGAIQPEFKEYLAQMNEWYEMDLIYPDFVAGDEEILKGRCLAGSSAIAVCGVENMNTWLTTAEIEGASGGPGYPAVLNKGDRVQTRAQNYQARFPYSAVITTQCENPEAAAAFLDYGYCEEGYMLYNYGFEGVTYDSTETVEYNGIEYTVGKFNPMIYGEADAVFVDQLTRYKWHIGSFIRFEHESNPNMAKAENPNRDMRKWLTEQGDTTLNLPNVSMTADEAVEYAKIMTEVEELLSNDTCLSEFLTKENHP